MNVKIFGLWLIASLCTEWINLLYQVLECECKRKVVLPESSSTNQLFIKLWYSPSFNATTRQQSLFSTRKETFLHALQCKGGGGQGGEITPFHIIQFAEVFSTKICIKVGTIDEIFQSEPVLEGLLGWRWVCFSTFGIRGFEEENRIRQSIIQSEPSDLKT